mgnify:FL=1|jgi:hypothetical protein
MGRKRGTPQLRGRLPKYNAEGMVTCPPNIPERWFRFKMARHETVNVLGIDYELQSVSPQWYFEQNDKCGMTGSRDTARYMDIMFKNVVTSPANVASKGLKAFEENEDIETPELLIREIERFLRPGKKSGSSAAAGDKK